MILKRQFATFSRLLVNWNESAILVDKKSKFQGRCVKITRPDEVPDLIAQLIQSEKSLSKASHPSMYAWRVGTVSPENRGNDVTYSYINQSSHDNGENGAGSRILVLLEKLKLVNVLVVVSRWYGGTPLGPSRFRDISQVAIESLKNGGFISADNKSRNKKY